MANAKEVMTENPITLESSTPILDAVELFKAKKFSSVPVVTPLGDVAGQLTEIVLVRVVVLNQIQPEKYKILAHCIDLLEPAVFVSPMDPIASVIAAILKSPSRRVLVRSDGKKIHGIVSPKDLLRTLASGSTTAKVIQDEVKKLA